MIARIAVAGLAVVLVGCGDEPSSPGGPDPGPPRAVAVTFGGGALGAELATTAVARSTGLSGRATIAPDSGMLFAWPVDQSHQLVAFHMVNTQFDLDVAFIGADKRVINIASMTRNTTTFHFATAPFRYALESPRGWFAARGIVAGAQATFTIPATVVIEP